MRSFVLLAFAIIAGVTNANARADLIHRSATLAQLLPEQAASFAAVIPPDRKVAWTLRVPDTTSPHGVIAFVSPLDSGGPPDSWTEVLEQQNLIWVSAEHFGNATPTAQRILAAVMGLALVQRDYAIDRERIYIAGMSGGGRVASKAIATSPQLFTGAIYFCGADPLPASVAPSIAISKRFVFVTGTRDFNRREMKHVARRYSKLGVRNVLVLDIPGMGHELADAGHLEEAIQYLDAAEHRQ
jgi:predicted esterase